MYLIRNEIAALPGRARDVEAKLRRVFDTAKDQKGFARGGFGVSYSYPNRYAGIALWQSREDALAFYRGEGYQAALQELAPLITAVGATPVRAYEEIHAVVDPSTSLQTAGCIMLIDLTTTVDLGPALEANVKQAYDLRRQHGKGFITNRLLRAYGNPSQYLSYWVHTSREDLLATANLPAVREFMRSRPVTAFTQGGAIAAVEQYEVLHVVGA